MCISLYNMGVAGSGCVCAAVVYAGMCMRICVYAYVGILKHICVRMYVCCADAFALWADSDSCSGWGRMGQADVAWLDRAEGSGVVSIVGAALRCDDNR